MAKKNKPNAVVVQELLNQLSYEDFITVIAVMADQHPLGGIKQIQSLPSGNQCVIFAKSYRSLDEAMKVVKAIEKEA